MKLKKLLAALMALTIVAGASTVSVRPVNIFSLTASAEGDEYTEGTYGYMTYEKYDDHIEITGCDESAEGELIIPNEIEGLPVTSIGNEAFYFCYCLESIIIPDSVTSIGAYAFDLCSSLESITIPESVTSIGESAFHYCSSLESIIIPDSVTSIGNKAFSRCTNLTAVTLSNSLTSIEKGTFSICASLETIIIPESVTSIGEDAFYLCASLETIIIPDSVTSIGDMAFEACYDLTSITIPCSVTSIGYRAFYECSSLESIIILNPDCDIFDEELTISGYDNENRCYYFNGIIYGYENSTAQAYAEKYGYKFESLGEAPVIEPKFKLGDTNSDGKVDATDASYILSLYAKISTSSEAPTEFEWAVCDVDGDGRIDATDASTVLAYYSYVSTGGDLSFEYYLKM